MPNTKDDLKSDWIHGVFGILRQEAVSLSADFGRKVQAAVDVVADVAELQPPSTASMLAAIALETSNIAASLVSEGSTEVTPSARNKDIEPTAEEAATEKDEQK